MKNVGLVIVGLAIAATAVVTFGEVAPDSGYPATVKPLSRQRRLELQGEFRELNRDREHQRTIDARIDRYGRISSEDSTPDDEVPAAIQMSKQRILALGTDFCARNKRFVGIADVSQLELSRSDPIEQFLPGGQRVVRSWRLDFSIMRKVDGIPVVNAGYIVLWLDAYGVKSIQGSGFGDVPVVIPKRDLISPSDAKRLLIGRTLRFSGFDGEPSSHVITDDDFKNGDAEKVILPLAKDDRIEMRVVWRLGVGGNLGTSNWNLYVDTTTGEVVKEEQLFRT